MSSLRLFIPQVVLLVASLLFTSMSSAADRYITLNEGTHINLPNTIGKVFISNPQIADYKVIDENTIVVFASSLGQARLIVYGTEQDVLLSDKIIVDLDLSQVRRQLAFHFPNLDIKVQSIGSQVAVSGVVSSEEERDAIYLMVATLLGREKTERWHKAEKLEFKLPNMELEEPESMVFARNMTWEGIIERLEVATTQQVKRQDFSGSSYRELRRNHWG
ncbi:type II/IV secretion system secretin RcpA/CpaC [Vibrio maritimus]|uniref:Type II/IV secretion system secretin RcpA/CpaC n=1 Tax=Vibrio maritimus TaxID=990268 RepID=A0A090S027_9VIBR|nr:type II/IV secretion system secretin RcpA/CpaC [Vibrio maritimus]